jgi:PBP1b-binding outer membrane lipoprotein LpoB
MLRRPLQLSFLGMMIAAILFFAGCSGPDAPPKKSGGSGKSLTTAAP